MHLKKRTFATQVESLKEQGFCY